jgi:hypothetical protein
LRERLARRTDERARCSQRHREKPTHQSRCRVTASAVVARLLVHFFVIGIVPPPH